MVIVPYKCREILGSINYTLRQNLTQITGAFAIIPPPRVYHSNGGDSVYATLRIKSIKSLR